MNKSIFKHLYFWVLVGVVSGAAFGFWQPQLGEQLKILGDVFINLVKMLIGPLIFCTVSLGLAGMGDMKKLGRVGFKTLLYFEIISTLALVIGLIVANTLKPGHGLHADIKSMDPQLVADFAKSAANGPSSFVQLLIKAIPKTFTDAFTGSGDLIQILFISVLFGLSMSRLRKKSETVHILLERVAEILFGMINLIMKLAPVGAFGAMAFTIGKFGIKAMGPLLTLMGCFYLTCALFIVIVLGAVCRYCGFSIFKFLNHIKSEVLLVLGTSSSESALAPLMQKLENLGCSKSIIRLVIPSGYSFNLDGTNIYLTMAALFIAQAFDIDLSLKQQFSILLVATLTSKGASGVTGAGFITLAATLAVVPEIPISGLALILGVDRFMSEARAITNMIGNGVAAIAMSKWERELDQTTFNRILNGETK